MRIQQQAYFYVQFQVTVPIFAFLCQIWSRNFLPAFVTIICVRNFKDYTTDPQILPTLKEI